MRTAVYVPMYAMVNAQLRLDELPQYWNHIRVRSFIYEPPIALVLNGELPLNTEPLTQSTASYSCQSRLGKATATRWPLAPLVTPPQGSYAMPFVAQRTWHHGSNMVATLERLRRVLHNT